MFISSFSKLKSYCEMQDYVGWDPFDGLNSKVFQSTPLKNWDIARLIWIQGFKRSPINFRKIFLVPKEHNSKGVGLLLTSYCNIYKAQKLFGESELGTINENLIKINYLANLLLTLRCENYSGACWGYNFDWQARRLFLFPKNTPTVVATTFCAISLFHAYEITQNVDYLKIALTSADFIINDLNRTIKERGFLFSYSPIEGNNTVYNASLLGSKLLSYCYYYSREERYKEIARESIIACTDAQQFDGSWYYGELPVQKWKDSFHTGYNLEAIKTYQDLTGDETFASVIERGFNFYINNFFLSNGKPKYFHDKLYPIDIHCPAQLFVTLDRLNQFENQKDLTKKVMDWTIAHMQDKKGFFYYQLKNGFSSKISYMRWSNAFMLYAMSYFYLNVGNE